MMAAAAAASAHWPAGTVHCEYFTGPGAAPPARLDDDRPFTVRLARCGGEYHVPPGESILDVLRRHGVETRASCELGYCGACLTRCSTASRTTGTRSSATLLARRTC